RARRRLTHKVLERDRLLGVESRRLARIETGAGRAVDPLRSRHLRRTHVQVGRLETGFFVCGHGFRLRNGLSWRHDLGLYDKNPVSHAMPEQ
ncbi:MAG TPA: hypothetical protein PK170_10680, partial [Anaerolineae bacterium]|nr:hypothetical protein [Anaerolineae bacterium]